MDTSLTLQFTTSAADIDQLPDSRAEVAIVGRSNVGKSSLLNALGGSRRLARTSKTPGRTQLLNVFSNGRGGTVVDLPGYGWAKTSATERRAWHQRMERYLTARVPLVMTMLLIDAEVGPTGRDLQMLGWLRERDVEFTVIATKHDKVRASKRDRRRRDLAAGCGLPASEVLWVSANTGVNIDRLRATVGSWLAAPPQKRRRRSE